MEEEEYARKEKQSLNYLKRYQMLIFNNVPQYRGCDIRGE